MRQLLNKLNHNKAVVGSICWLAFVLGIILAANTGNLCWAYQLADAIPLFDKLGHAFLFGMLSFIAGLAMPSQADLVVRWHLPTGSLLVLMLSILEECSQLFLIHRNFDLLDMTVNMLAIILAGVVAKSGKCAQKS